MSKRLRIGNLSGELEETGLESAFAPWGGRFAMIPFDPGSGRSKGFGFIEVEDDQVHAAISAMNGADLAGQPVTVAEARSRIDRGNDGRATRG